MSTTQQPEALRLAELCDNFQKLEKIGTELRRQHARIAELEASESRTITQRDHCEEVIDRMADAVLGKDRHEWTSNYDYMDAAQEVEDRIAELEAQLSAIGAGGVEPLRKRASTADVVVADERDAFDKWLRIKPCGAAHDFGWQAWKARAALASTPVAGELATLQAGLQAAAPNAPLYDPREVAFSAQAAPQAVQAAVPVAGQSRFKGEKDWHWCSPEHVAMVAATPSEWQGYEARYLYAHAAPAHPAEGVPAPMPVLHPHHCTARTADGSCEECEGHAQAMAEWNAERTALAATNPTQQGLDKVTLLSKDHTGMKVDYSGLLGQVRREIKRSAPGLAEMIRQLQEHMQELGQRWYAGDTAVVDELLQLYSVERQARDALAAQAKQGEQANG